MRRTALNVFAALVVLSASSPLLAATLSAGDQSNTNLTVSIPAGSTLLASQTLSGTGISGQAATVMEFVYKDASTGGIDFAYQVKDTGTDIVESITASVFKSLVGTTIDVGGSGSGNAPDFVSWSSNGSVVKWDFTSSGTLQPGDTSQLLVVKTSAKNFTAGLFSIQDGSTITIAGYQPGPEPSTLALAGVGALGLIGYGLRRRKTSDA